MELDLSDYRFHIIALVFLLLLAGAGWLGSAYTPAGDQPLTWSEWQVLKARRAYLRELAELRAAAESLTALLNNRPDPVRAQLAAENIQRLTGKGLPALAYQRGKLTLASQAVSDWAVGAIDHETALQALDQAIQALLPQPPGDPSPESTLDPRSDPLIPGVLPMVSRP
jgi:hypothetical protein